MRSLLVIASLMALTVPTSMATADEDPPTSLADLEFPAATPGPLDTEVDPLKNLDGRVTVMVELPKAPVAAAEASTGGNFDQAQEQAVRSDVEAEQNRLTPAIEGLGGSIESRMQSAYNGMRVTIDAQQLDNLKAVEGVKGIHAIPQYEPTNTTSVPYLGVPTTWQGTGDTDGYTGKGVKVAVVDSGVDYTHATFGGPGTTEAFREATAVNDQSRMAGTRVKGGRDFAGDSYNGSNTPVPDDNPIDCDASRGAPAGHGTHVAATAAGSGVLADGSTYTGSHDENTHTSNDFTVGPGVAPEAEIYALRIFGCSGGTNLVTEAMDWAVANHMDVVNLSLGSSYGRVDSPDAVAVANAVAAGVVVVAASGNSGSQPYLTSSPGTGAGVVSVAANDPTATHPTADLEVGDSTIEAMNVNGAKLPANGGIKVLRDGDRIGTGCDAAQWEAARVQGKVVVVRRDENFRCDHAQQAVLAQDHGAAGVIMVNTTNGLPEHTGVISQVLPTKKPVKVTIPFLGVRSSAGETLLGADGQNVEITETTLANPAYTRLASFSSAGPRSGDSALRPTVTAPGVGITSALSGSGNNAKVSSGTSMAAPHATGVAALARQAHPDWTSQEISAAMVSTADTDRVGDYSPTKAGGLVDPADTVHTSLFAYSDSTTIDGNQVIDASISFGYAEFVGEWTGDRVVTLVNKGDQPVTLRGDVEPSAQSLPAKITLATPEVTVPARGSAKVPVTLHLFDQGVPSSDDQRGRAFFEVSGLVRFTADSGQELTLPYLLVPRSISKVGVEQQTFSTPTQSTVHFTNKGDHRTLPILFTWGLQDPADIPDGNSDVGQDISSVAVASFVTGGETYLNFVVNSSSRFSNPTNVNFSIIIDKDLDGTDDYLVFTQDGGLARGVPPTGSPDIFVRDLKEGTTKAADFAAIAPSDSSSVLMRVKAADVGVSGKFAYGAQARNAGDPTATDVVAGKAYYDPKNKAFEDARLLWVSAKSGSTVELNTNEALARDLGVLGYLLLVFDNAQGTSEAVTGPVIDPTQAVAEVPSAASGAPEEP